MGEKLGFLGLAFGEQKPDLIIINSCCVTKKAEKEVKQMIRRIKRENPKVFLVVAGCFINNIENQKANSKNSKMTRLIDLIVKNEEKNKIGELLKERFSEWENEKKRKSYQDKYANSKKALIRIQTGCDNFCSYCIVPYVRGRSVSRDPEEIIKEIKQKTREGIREVILTGVDISNYNLKSPAFASGSSTRLIKSCSAPDTSAGKQKLKFNKSKNGLVKLIRKILEETKINKISFGSINIEAFDKEFINLHQNKKMVSRLSSHFHIPLQSGSETVLKRMRRCYTAYEFKDKIVKLKSEIQNFSFSTDIIVGFPGETEEEFQETLETIKYFKKILGKNFIKVHFFRYSSRPGTLAGKREEEKGWEKVAEEVRRKRTRFLRMRLAT